MGCSKHAAKYMCDVQDVGCCMGQDIRQLMTDGWKQSQLVAMDLDADYWHASSPCHLSLHRMACDLHCAELTKS